LSEHDINGLRRIYEALSRWDVEELANDVAHDIELNIPDSFPWGGRFHGIDGVRAFATIFEEYVEGFWAEPDDFLDAGDEIVVVGRFRGRGTESRMEFEVGFVHLWTIRDGVASRCRAYLDTAPVMAAIEGRGDAEPDTRRAPS
jgi:uncharacterized protein